ncbi:S41 family peptidase [Maribacter sp. HTCC2170]|uniref:S41 family peptidase n=1 Tax=Maribacter sp. (strain HTCC2170 / KCCM 42371) TaxID=313603 RepID=UPI00006B4865|nr:S41 family peptidase [Maribacter sp. HTCC2170]EAR01662.1 putative peptidase/protease family protein [Maribacter sp. HTCC2170]
MKIRTFYFTFLLSTFFAFAQINPQWVRYPSISPDGSVIAFTYKGNLYSVATSGGDATQLTFHEAHDYATIWSKDGKTLSFASNRYGNFDVFTMDAKGGPATRLTFHSNNERPYTFSADDSEVFFGAQRQDDVAHRQYPTGSQPELYAVSKEGGRVRQVLTLPIEDVQVNNNGSQLIYHDKKGYEDEFRKHHVSSITRDVWTFDVSSGEHKMITSFAGEDRNPVYSQDQNTVYYLSEESGTFNVHKMSLENPTQNERLTSLAKHPVRSLSIGAGTMAFSYDGELYTLKDGEEPNKVQINIRTQAGTNSDKFVSIKGGVQEMDISPDGKQIAFISRGEVFVTSVENSLTKRLTNTPEQERFVKFTHDGKAVAYSSERNGKWSIYQTKKVRKEEPFFYGSTLVKEETLVSSNMDVYLPEFSPDGNSVAFIEGRRTLKVMNLKTKETKTLLTPKDLFHMSDGDKYFKWSPDSKWLLVSWAASLSNGEILMLAADGSKRENLTESGYYDFYPKWVNGGEQMIWFANRHGLKSYATSGRSQADVYSMFLTKESWDKFKMTKEENELNKQIEEINKEDKDKKEVDKGSKKKKKDEDKDKKEEAVKTLKFDWEDLKSRKSRLTIHSSRLADAVLSKDGEKLYYLAQFEKGLNLWETELRTKSTKMLVSLGAKSASLQWDKKQENLFLLSDGKISKVDLKAKKTKAVKINSEMVLDADAERRFMFDHIWLRTNAIFYHSNFHGIDWKQMRTEYEKYLPHIGNSHEFAEMISEFLGELNVSHAGGRYRGSIPNGDATASLGIFMDYSHSGNGIKIAEILNGGPLDKASLKLKKGMVIDKINGETIMPSKDVATYLNRIAGNFTLLEVLDSKGARRQITVKPISLGEERGLLYKRWVKQNEKEVEKKSNGTLGYVHIPGMSDGPYRTIYERMMGKFSDKKAVIVDTRFNGGGDLVADLAMFFTGVPFISYETESRRVGGEPTSRWTKPTLAMYNESMYSDGHCFASGYSDLKIGKTVGMPVPGTCSFAGWERLPNGGVWGVVPVSAKNKAGEWMENNQTNPDIKVKNMPGVVDKGRDEQLERSIEELMKEVK